MSENRKPWNEQTPEFYQFTTPEQELVGVLVSRGMVPMRDAEVLTYTLEVEPGKRVKFLGGVSLDSMMEPIEIGQEIRLIYGGKEKTSTGYQVKKFRLFTR